MTRERKVVTPTMAVLRKKPRLMRGGGSGGRDAWGGNSSDIGGQQTGRNRLSAGRDEAEAGWNRAEATLSARTGASASPHAVVRHSHAPPAVTAEQCPPLPHAPSQRRVSKLNSQDPPASVVVVEPIVATPNEAGAQRNCAALNLTTLVPLKLSVTANAGGKGFGQVSL